MPRPVQAQFVFHSAVLCSPNPLLFPVVLFQPPQSAMGVQVTTTMPAFIFLFFFLFLLTHYCRKWSMGPRT